MRFLNEKNILNPPSIFSRGTNASKLQYSCVSRAYKICDDKELSDLIRKWYHGAHLKKSRLKMPAKMEDTN